MMASKKRERDRNQDRKLLILIANSGEESSKPSSSSSTSHHTACEVNVPFLLFTSKIKCREFEVSLHWCNFNYLLCA